MVNSVQVDAHLQRSSDVGDKLNKLFRIGSNRRALGTSSLLRQVSRLSWEGNGLISRSGRCWTTSDPAIVRIQYTHVLLCIHLRSSRIQECHGRGANHRHGQPCIHPRRSQGITSRSSRHRSVWLVGRKLTEFKIVDPFGRRRTMLYTIPIMAMALLAASIFFYCKSTSLVSFSL